MKKRLFLFAGYDKSAVIDDALIFYVRALGRFGDVVLFMDCDCDASQLAKIDKYCLYAGAKRHGEYDFGSYKRAYLWAQDNLKMAEYDFVYLVNDSVYGPLYDLGPYLENMESGGCDAFGIVKNPHREHPHIQSWFVGMKKTVFESKWFDSFMKSVKKQKSKGEVTRKYEQGLTQLIERHKLCWGCLYSVPGRGVYNNVKKLYREKMPFVKRVAFTRNHGALGRQLRWVMENVDAGARGAIMTSVRRVYGDKYTDWLMGVGPFGVIIRNLRHVLYKLFIEGI